MANKDVFLVCQKRGKLKEIPRSKELIVEWIYWIDLD
jgi:hypothetical protein